MTGKNKADQSASLKTSRGNDTRAHLAELELLLVDQLCLIGQPWPFGKLIERMVAEGFTRCEIVAAVNQLEAEGVIQYRRWTHLQTQPPRAELQVVLVEEE
jgi:hypothetical protein